MAKASGGPQAPALAARNRGKWQKSRAGIEPTTLRNTARDLSDQLAPVKSKSAGRMQLYIIQSMDNGIQSIQRGVAGPAARRGRSARGLGALKRRKTGRAPMLMVGAWVRAPSIRRSEPPGAVCLAARSAAACAPCLGSGSDAKSLARACIGRPLEPAGTGRPRWLWRVAGSSCAEMLPITAAEAGKALGPMLPASARER